MKILALETSSTAASAAVIEDGYVLTRTAVNRSLTHSQTLLPMVQEMLKNAALSLSDMEAIAVAAGPGSFTGVRIGVAVVKGLAFGTDIPCVPVSTLAAMARMWEDMPFCGEIVAAMDARCQQVYTARFRCDNGTITRITSDEALPAKTVCERLVAVTDPILLIGDGAKLCYDLWKDQLPTVKLAPPAMRMQDAVGVAKEAVCVINAGGAVSAEALQPSYLRLPQAERERLARLNKEG